MENLKNKDSFLENRQLVIALSGGIDSVVLLHYLHTHYPNNLRAIHCNHHLSKHCTEWDEFCKNLCQTLNIPYSNVDIFIENESNLEENARKKRYHSLSSNLEDNEVLCTAHHQNDQAETILLQLFRGAGVAGLAAMPKSKPLGKGTHYRPMLNIKKSEIIDYAKNNHLSWVEDDSNTNTNFRRNFLRLDIIPKLETVYKNLAKTLTRSAKHQSEALKLTRELADIDINTHHVINNSGRINISALKKIETHRIKNILRHHLSLMKFLAPSDKIMDQIIDLLHAKEDAQPLVSWDNFEIRRYQDELYLIDNQTEQKSANCPLHAEFENFPNFSIRYRIEGQRIKLPGKKHSQSLKKVLQDANIPPWERNSLKMYYIEDELRAMERLGRMEHAE
ncbi:MAG: tRNA lysidine(34) synthetase TilS [Gammaproteobacteria bacterium]|nr:MAG: tRNA lysidine(34) synthetase TilS [Gammaproteobacteria bacterium]